MVKLFVFSQQEAIEKGKEKLTLGLIKKVANEKLRLLQPMLDAIRSGNPYKMAKYEDIKRIELEQQTKPLGRERENTRIIIEKMSEVKNNEKVVNQTNSKVTKKVKRIKEYKKGDLRYLLQKGQEEGKTPYQVLLENNFIDDMSIWKSWGEGHD